MRGRIENVWIPLSTCVLALALATFSNSTGSAQALRSPRANTKQEGCEIPIDKKNLLWEFDSTTKALTFNVKAVADSKTPPYDANLTVVVSGKFKEVATGKIVRLAIFTDNSSKFGVTGKLTIEVKGEISDAALQNLIKEAEADGKFKFADQADKLTLSAISSITDSGGCKNGDSEKKETPKTVKK